MYMGIHGRILIRLKVLILGLAPWDDLLSSRAADENLISLLLAIGDVQAVNWIALTHLSFNYSLLTILLENTQRPVHAQGSGQEHWLEAAGQCPQSPTDAGNGDWELLRRNILEQT